MITEKAIEKGVNEKKNVGEDKERRGRCQLQSRFANDGG